MYPALDLLSCAPDYHLLACLPLGRPVFVAYVTAGYPEATDTVDVLLALQEGGADIIELGVPFSDPMADGPTIQESSFVSTSLPAAGLFSIPNTPLPIAGCSEEQHRHFTMLEVCRASPLKRTPRSRGFHGLLQPFSHIRRKEAYAGLRPRWSKRFHCCRSSSRRSGTIQRSVQGIRVSFCPS